MTQRRVTETKQLATVVDALQLGKKTGILTVERGEGEAFEEGVITLVDGQAVSAAIGPYKGKDAITRLLSWQVCRFSFVPALPGQGDTGQMRGLLPVTQSEMRGNSRFLSGPFDRVQQMYPAVQARLNPQPFPAAHSQEALDNILLALDRQGFSRIHRRLFLLIDGRRSIEELAALISRTPDETMSLLENLEQAGFIQL